MHEARSVFMTCPVARSTLQQGPPIKHADELMHRLHICIQTSMSHRQASITRRNLRIHTHSPLCDYPAAGLQVPGRWLCITTDQVPATPSSYLGKKYCALDRSKCGYVVKVPPSTSCTVGGENLHRHSLHPA